MGRLVPASYNLWIGNSSDGSSSGLHHDYHDNIYVLVRGRKRFRLFSPADAKYMHTRGKISKIHKNGRICYEGAETEADGSDAELVRITNQRFEAEAEISEAEAALAKGEEGKLFI